MGLGGGGLVAKSCLTLATPWTVALQAPLSMDFPGKNAGVGCHFLLQGIFLTQGSNSGLLHRTGVPPQPVCPQSTSRAGCRGHHCPQKGRPRPQSQRQRWLEPHQHQATRPCLGTTRRGNLARGQAGRLRPGAPQDEAGLTRKFETSHVSGATCRTPPIPRPGYPVPGILQACLSCPQVKN